MGAHTSCTGSRGGRSPGSAPEAPVAIVLRGPGLRAQRWQAVPVLGHRAPGAAAACVTPTKKKKEISKKIREQFPEFWKFSEKT